MQIIIVGGGKVGSTLAEQLSKEGNDITVIDRRYEVVQNMSNEFDVMGIVGNGSSHKIQIEAGIENADLLIAVTGSDELNLLCCLIAKKAGNCQTIARVRNPEYNEEMRFIKEELGLAMAINPELASAVEMARVLRFPTAIKIETFAKGKVEVLKFKIGKGSVLNNIQVSQIATKLKCDVLVCAVEREDDVIIPTGNTILRENDIISIVASPKHSSQFFKRINIVTNQVRNTMIAGGGEIAYYLTKQLLNMGIEVKIIEKDKARCEELSELLPKASIILGDASSQQVLMEEGLANMDSFVTLTNMDEENILLSLFARRVSNMKVITKISSIAFNDVINHLDLDTIIYPKYVTSEYIMGYVRAMKNSIGSNVENMYRLVENKVEALEFVIREKAPVLNKTLEQLDLKENLLIGCINRNGEIITPKGQDVLKLGDTVVVVTTNTGLKDISDILRD
ncbi:Trk system potassium transporter TrkA [Murimonas intestini]|uniref:Trk system potassium transporter TrkA n=1 Tax=Murimonas intestini TaxID=1337051 RepID=UPI0011DC8625|nr:Trk system potassium transporter TrkA [Murimonas intestini]